MRRTGIELFQNLNPETTYYLNQASVNQGYEVVPGRVWTFDDFNVLQAVQGSLHGVRALAEREFDRVSSAKVEDPRPGGGYLLALTAQRPDLPTTWPLTGRLVRATNRDLQALSKNRGGYQLPVPR